MSVVRMAVRLCIVEALKGRTLVGDNVKDLRIGAIDIAADGSLRLGEDKPFADVYTDDSDATDVGASDLRQNGVLAVSIETGIATVMTATNDETGESQILGIGLAATDDNFERTLDVLNAQIAIALTDPENPWAELWQRLHRGTVKIERRRIAREDDEVRPRGAPVADSDRGGS